MFKTKKPNPKKALGLEKKGDVLFARGKFREALKQYQKSEAFNPDRREIYKKLCDALTKFEHDWTEEDFSNSMTWTMREQEFENPNIRFVYETFTPEYHEVQKLIQSLILAPEEKIEYQVIEKIIGFGAKAHLPLLHFLLSIKKMGREKSTEPSPPSPEKTH